MPERAIARWAVSRWAVSRWALIAAIVVVAPVLAACSRPAVGPPAAPSSSTPGPTSVAAGSEEARLRLLRSVFGADARLPDPGEAKRPYDASAIALRYPDRELWIASTSGAGVYETGASRRQVAALYERRNGDWVEVARLPLGSVPVTTSLRQLAGPVLRAPVAWIAVVGTTAGGGGTYELLRYDGATLTSSFWWFSPLPQAGTETDLDGDGVPEVVLDASDPGVLCATCEVLDINVVVYRWVGQELVPVQVAPMPGSPVEGPVERAITLANAGLWSDAAAMMVTTRVGTPNSEDVRWMAIVMDYVAAARRAQAGSPAQPLLTEVLAGDYAAAARRIRRLEAGEAFSPEGPLVQRTAAEGRATALGAALVQAASDVIRVRPALSDAYLVRALGHYLRDPQDPTPAISDALHALNTAPDDGFIQAVVARLTSTISAR